MLTPFPHCAKVVQLRRNEVKTRWHRPGDGFYQGRFRSIARDKQYSDVKITVAGDGYRLSYGFHKYKGGTGPFRTRADAIAFFTNGGR